MHPVRPATRMFGSASASESLRALMRNLPGPANADLVADMLAECATPGATVVVGITGSVASGKSTLSTSIANRLQSTKRVEIISTDGFLFPNEVLLSNGLIMRKGFPETYDVGLLSGVLQRARWGAVRVPAYSHITYDRSPEHDRTIDRPDIMLVEGLGFALNSSQRSPAALLDILIYLDAREDDLECWFVSRFMNFWRDAETDPASFYARFRSMSETEAEAFARQVWNGINLPNLRDNIAPIRQEADILITKSADHSMQISVPALDAAT